MKTTVRVLRGRHRGRVGWISGDLLSRSALGITKAIVKFSDDVELLETKNLELAAQLLLFPEAETKTPPAVSQRREMSDARFSRRLVAGDEPDQRYRGRYGGGRQANKTAYHNQKPANAFRGHE